MWRCIRLSSPQQKDRSNSTFGTLPVRPRTALRLKCTDACVRSGEVFWHAWRLLLRHARSDYHVRSDVAHDLQERALVAPRPDIHVPRHTGGTVRQQNRWQQQYGGQGQTDHLPPQEEDRVLRDICQEQFQHWKALLTLGSRAAGVCLLIRVPRCTRAYTHRLCTGIHASSFKRPQHSILQVSICICSINHGSNRT